VYVLIFYALGIPSTPEFYVVIYFIATAFQDAAASFSVRLLDIILATIFLLYGLNPGVSGIAALLVRSVGFWFPLFVGFVCLQIVGTRSLISQTPQLKTQNKKQQASQTGSLNGNIETVTNEHFHWTLPYSSMSWSHLPFKH
jgi:hypothetical protein